jgi:hypothetical protein
LRAELGSIRNGELTACANVLFAGISSSVTSSKETTQQVIVPAVLFVRTISVKNTNALGVLAKLKNGSTFAWVIKWWSCMSDAPELASTASASRGLKRAVAASPGPLGAPWPTMNPTSKSAALALNTVVERQKNPLT